MSAHDTITAATARAAQELAVLQKQADGTRAELSDLQQQVSDAKDTLAHGPTVQLVAANERLVLAVLTAQADADAAARELSELARTAEHDALTELPNRVLLLDRFSHAIASAKRHRVRLALLFLDLNDFKKINDTLGHAIGDQVLKRAADCLSSCVRGEDTVSRYGGDEFVVLLSEVGVASDATRVAEKMIALLGAPNRVGDHVFRIAASIGICVYPDDGEDPQLLIDRADAAMYRAKRRGLGGFAVHDPDLVDLPHKPTAKIAGTRPSYVQYESAVAEHERRHAQMVETNEQLVLSALNADVLQSAAGQAHRRQSEFLSVLSNELKDPMTPIRNATTMLSQVSAKDLPRMQAVIQRQVTYLTRLLGDLLDTSRVHSGKFTLETSQFDLVAIIEDAVEACRPGMDARLQHLHTHVAAGPLEMVGDPVRLAQILANLLGNASKFTPDGGAIGLSAAIVGQEILITVSDDGIGISAEALPDVFKPFVQDDHAVGFNGMGVGIGLTAVCELVQAHGGKVVASSAGIGKGSRFVVTLPRGANLWS